MSDDIPYDKSFNLTPGHAEEVVPGVRRLLCDNPSPFTFKGTVSYILGKGHVAIVDPGPDDDTHIDALLNAVRGETVTHIFVTHTHRDHSPAVKRVKAETGATVYAEGPHRAARPLYIGEINPLDSAGDRDFKPDVILADGEVVIAPGFEVEAITTPGHTANHMSFALRGTPIMLSGDHVMAWSTSIVAPPDGAMSDYMASLEKVGRRAETYYLPGHGGAVVDAPRFVRHVLIHRRNREASILRWLGQDKTDIPALVAAMYVGLDPRLTGAAGLSVLAHLEDLVTRGLVSTDGTPSINGNYRLAASR